MTVQIPAIGAAVPFPYSHCHQCGTPYADAQWPRKCVRCGDLRWHNPTPIGVLLQTVTDGTRIGVLTPVRGHGPQLGCEGLTGGFEEASDDGVDDAAMREYREEIHRDGDVRREALDIIQSRGSGAMYPPGKRQSLTFSVNPVPVHVDEFKDWVPDAETTAIEFSWEPRVLAFPTHTLALAAYFRKYQGVDAPASYFDQPLTGDAVVFSACGGEPRPIVVHNVVYAQPRLDQGIWCVQLEPDGPAVGIVRAGEHWTLADWSPEDPAAKVYVDGLDLMPARDDIERLKREWAEDPHWDLEETPGFAAAREELAAFAALKQTERDRLARETVNARAAELGCSPQLAQYVLLLEQRLARLEATLSA